VKNRKLRLFLKIFVASRQHFHLPGNTLLLIDSCGPTRDLPENFVAVMGKICPDFFLPR
jgi:hypothetical protein